MIHSHYERKYNQPGMTLPAAIYSMPCLTPQTIGRKASYSLHRRATLLPGYKPPQFAIVGNLLRCDELHIAITLQSGAIIFKSTECCCGKFIDRLGLRGLSYVKNTGCFLGHSAWVLFRSQTETFLKYLKKI